MAHSESQPDFALLASKVLLEAKKSILSYENYYPQFLLLVQKVQLTSNKLSSNDPRILIYVCILALTLFIYCACQREGCQTPERTFPLDPRLRLLTAFVVPTLSSKQDARLVSFTRDGIVIDLAHLLDEIISGSLELRHPQNLQAIFQNQLVVAEKCRISLRVGSGWKIRVMRWVLASYTDTRKMDLSGLRCKAQNRHALFLDPIPQPDIEDAVARFTACLTSGNRAKIVFTARNPRIRFMSESFLLCAVPFISAGKSATPLSTSLDHIVSCLTRTPDVRIVTVTNDSQPHATNLYEAEWSLVEDREYRTLFIECRGERRWRKHRMMLAWEAALHASGLLDRWTIVVEK